MKLTSIFAAAVCAAACISGCATDKAVEAKSGPIHDAIAKYVDAGRIAGVVSAVSDKEGRVQYDCVGWADLENKKPMRPDTMFACFSMSKSFLGAAMMCAIDEGKISLDDPVSKFFPEYNDVKVATKDKDGKTTLVPAKRPLTIRDLTCHVNGASYSVDMIDRTMTLEDVARNLAKKPFRSQPGEKFAYGTCTIDAAGACLEKAVGKPYAEYLQEKVLDPLGMKDTTFWPNAEQVSRLVKAYTSDDKLPIKPAADHCAKQLVFPKKNVQPVPGAGLYSTPQDMVRFSQMLARHGEWNGKRIISRKTFDEIFAVKQTPANISSPYTCGNWIYGDWFGHEGAMRTDQRANLKTGHSRVFFIQTENKAGSAFFALKNDWHAACDKVQGTPATKFGN